MMFSELVATGVTKPTLLARITRAGLYQFSGNTDTITWRLNAPPTAGTTSPTIAAGVTPAVFLRRGDQVFVVNTGTADTNASLALLWPDDDDPA